MCIIGVRITEVPVCAVFFFLFIATAFSVALVMSLWCFLEAWRRGKWKKDLQQPAVARRCCCAIWNHSKKICDDCCWNWTEERKDISTVYWPVDDIFGEFCCQNNSLAIGCHFFFFGMKFHLRCAQMFYLAVFRNACHLIENKTKVQVHIVSQSRAKTSWKNRFTWSFLDRAEIDADF